MKKYINQAVLFAVVLMLQVMCPFKAMASGIEGSTELSGKGTEEEPYLIEDEAGWGLFCDALEDKEKYGLFSKKYIRLTRDISVTRMASESSETAFCGCFDGGGNTVSVRFGSETAPLEKSECALFRYTGGNSSIKNLNTDGVIHTKGANVSGLVGMVTGTYFGESGLQEGSVDDILHNSLVLDNCHVGVEIHTQGDVGGCLVGAVPPLNINNSICLRVDITGCTTDSHVYTSATRFGGIMGEAGASIRIKDCICSAVIHASKEGAGYHGGLISYPISISSISSIGPKTNVNTTYIEIDSCVFDGSFLGEKTSFWSGLVYYSEGAGGYIHTRDMFFAPEEIAVKDNGNRICLSRGSISESNGISYSTQKFGLEGDEILVEINVQPDKFYRMIDAPNGKRYYAQCPTEMIKNDFSYAEIQDPVNNMEAGLKDETGKELVAGEDFNVSVMRESRIDADGFERYILTFTANENNGYCGSFQKEVFVYDSLAHLPVITKQPEIMSLMYGYDGEHKFSIEAHAVQGHSLDYQWYRNTVPKTFGGERITGATGPELVIEPGLDLQTAYYYCELTSTRGDNGSISVIYSDLAMLTVRRREVFVTALGQTICQNGTIDKSLNKAVLTGALEGHELKALNFTTTDTDKVTDRGAIIPSDAVIMYRDIDVTDHYDVHYIQGVLKVEPLSPKPVDPDSEKNGRDETYYHRILNTGVEDEKGSFIIMDLYYKKSVSYNGAKHVDKAYSKADKRTEPDHIVSINSAMEGYAVPVLKYKNNKTAVIKNGKTPYFTLRFKAEKGISKNLKETVKSVNSYLKDQQFEFTINKADLEKARIIEFETKKGKIKKFIVEINGITMKLTKKDYDVRPNSNGSFSIAGKNNFCGAVTLK